MRSSLLSLYRGDTTYAEVIKAHQGFRNFIFGNKEGIPTDAKKGMATFL